MDIRYILQMNGVSLSSVGRENKLTYEMNRCGLFHTKVSKI